MADIVIAAAARTPVGSFNGAFAALPAHELGALAIIEVTIAAGSSLEASSTTTMSSRCLG